MKKTLLFICICLAYTFAKAQDQSQKQLFVGNGAADYKSADNNLKVQLQIGNPIISNLSMNASLNTRVGFPYGILYIAPTFPIDGFDVSKGYFTDKVNIKWEIGSNGNKIEKFKVYRKELGSATPEQLIATLGNDVFEYNDTQIEGGVLYTYKVEAQGVSSFNERYINFIDGVGFRNPTATVTGTISFDGGSPVKDAVVYAEANGAENKRGSSLNASNGYISIENIRYDLLANKLTLQSWQSGFGDSFKIFTDTNKTIIVNTVKTSDANIEFSIIIDGVLIQKTILSKSYPTGELDAEGNDVFANISDLTNTSFMHITSILEEGKAVKFLVNGRNLSESYIEDIIEQEGIEKSVFSESVIENYNFPITSKINKVILADNFNGILDEVRVWNRVLTEEEIRRDYRRYLEGNETALRIYLRMDENQGRDFYDLSRKGVRQNKNDGFFVKTGSSSEIFSATTPTSEQLGVFGITDENGSYTISSISYSGSGESFAITPSLGVHKFEPAKQTVYLGSEASVINQLNFKDVSSFKFNGKVIYNVQNVFKNIDLNDEEKGYTDIKDEGYNKYSVTNNGARETINKGQYYYEGGSVNITNNFYEGGELKKYPVIALEDANIYIDGDLAIDSDNQPVLTKADGTFTINVPIGQHKVEVRKQGHVFEYNGSFPSSGTEDFFEDQIDQSYFIDNTRITLIGRVTGGKTESEKPLGFGLDNELFTYTNFEGTENEEVEVISSKNNIGVATMLLKGNVNVTSLDVSIETDPVTGEYEKELIPYKYFLLKEDLKIDTNKEETSGILSSTEEFDLTATPALDSIKHTTKDGKELFSKKFHHSKSFRYNSPVTLTLLKQDYEKEITIDGNNYDISELPIPIYIQKNVKYSIEFEVSQNYINKDGGNNEITKEFYNEGGWNITNQLEIPSKSTINLTEDKKKYIYSFYAGEPNTTVADGFSKSINVQYIIPGSNPLEISNINDFKSEGIVKGGAKTGGTAFATIAPEIPDIILRDPPGSNSFASITKGTTISYTEEYKDSNFTENGGGLYASVGPKFNFSVGGLAFFTDTETKVVAEDQGQWSKSTESVGQNTTKNTYTFNQTISTRSDKEYVGSDGDLYIGNAKNVFYGTFNNMFVTDAPIINNNGATVPNIEIKAKNNLGNETTLYVSVNKDYFFAEQATNTFFAYSQKNIIDVVIPGLEEKAANFVAPVNQDPLAPIKRSAQDFTNAANTWRKIIQENEKTKYKAKNDREAYKKLILERVSNFGEYQTDINNLVNDNFFTNKSFDSGVGEITNSVTTAIIASSTIETNIVTSQEFKASLGFLVNDIGTIGNYTKNSNKVDTDIFTSENETTTTVSYTLSDNDKSNVLSVDIINMFDGNGPVFITQGGATSCPHEGDAITHFYKNSGYDPSIIGEGGETLSVATDRVYLPEIKVTNKLQTNIPESDGALFTLELKNKSETQTDLEYIIEVDALSLNGATTNIEANGVNIYLPFDETVETVKFPFLVYKADGSDRYNYENIRVYLKTPCDFINQSEAFVDVSVEFKKSCSNVSISSPEDNFIFNRSKAYTTVNDVQFINKLPITFTDFKTDFSGFQKIELEYRNSSSPVWIKFKSYYGSQELLDNANDDSGEVINSTEAEYTYNWDILGDRVNIPDGNYEIRAISYCNDDVSNVSDIISGVINLDAPVLFGTPQPSDGILDVGEDISLRFNEEVFKSITSEIKVKGLQNQQDIDHSVSVFLDGGSNTIELPNQILPKGSFTFQFWFKNATLNSGNLITQENGINASLNGNDLTFSIGDKSVTTTIDASKYNFYSLVYQDGDFPQLLIFENGTKKEVEVLTTNLDFSSNNSIFIGGNNSIGNIHDIRFWSKTFTGAQATVAKDKTLTGKEINLLGYWALDEGHGTIGIDKAKRRNAINNLNWDIFPKGTGYSFSNNSYLSLDNIGYVQPGPEEDITLSFWIKTNNAKTSTILSNGRGNNEEDVKTNGFRNKWSINMKSDGNLELLAEDTSYDLTSQSIADNKWHHVALVVKRGGSFNTFIDANETSSVSSIKLGGIVGLELIIGARLFNENSNKIVDNYFTGQIDEIRLWNTARSIYQINRDRYFEANPFTEGLLMYIDFNVEDDNTTKGPRYNHYAKNNVATSTFSILSNGSSQNYSVDSPPLKPKLKFTNIPVSAIINGDEIIIQPELTDEEWALYEGQILDFTVSKMSDEHFNEQLSPVSWSAYVSKQEIEWYTANQTKEIKDEKNVNEEYSFTMNIVNKGGNNQTYTISGLPTYITLAETSGIVSPNSTKQILFTVDKELTMGTYNANIYLETQSGFNDRLTLDLRVLTAAPDWSVNASDYANSMNVIGKIKVNNLFSRDSYTKIGAFVDNKPRGEAYLEYDKAYDSYFVYLTMYNNDSQDETVTFKIWDAINGRILISSIDSAPNTIFLQNEVLGSKSSPTIFSGDAFSEHNIELNKGWTWVSFYVEDGRFNNIKDVFDGLNLENGDQVKNLLYKLDVDDADNDNDTTDFIGEIVFSNFENDNWFGPLKSFKNTEMYKIKLANNNPLRLIGNDVDESKIHLNIQKGWNWLAFPIHRNIDIETALSLYNPTDGDVIKDQFSFAIYDATSGWSGTLKYMQSDRGYMLKSGSSQILNYPNSENSSKASTDGQTYTPETIEKFSKYKSNMSIVAEIVGGDAYTKVLVYDEHDILRGGSSIEIINNKKISFISVFSNSNDNLKFKLSDGITETNIIKGFIFENNKVFGNLNEPVELNLRSLSTNEISLNKTIIYPNPFSKTITIDSSNEDEEIVKIEIYNVIGSLVFLKKTNKNKTIINANNLAKGIYLLKLSTDSGKFVMKKIFKN